MPRVTMDDGAEINYQVDDLTPKWFGEPDTILMIHRHAENLHFLTPLIPPLAAKYRVVRMDMRGRGQSTAPPGRLTLSGGPDESTLFERQAKDAVALMDHLGIEKFHCWGAGGGGTTCLVIAIQQPERVKSLVLVAASCRIADEILTTWRHGEKDVASAIRKLGATEWIEKVWWNMTLDKSKADPKFAAWNLAQRKNMPENVVISCFDSAEKADICGRIHEINAATLLMSEEKSKIMPLEMAHYLQQQIPNSKLIVFHGMESGLHTITHERCAALTLEFLQNL